MVPDNVISDVILSSSSGDILLIIVGFTVYDQDYGHIVRALGHAQAIWIAVGHYDIYDLYHVSYQSVPVALPHLPFYWSNIYVRTNAM